MENVQVAGNFRVNEEQQQFELQLDGEIAFLEYFMEGKKIYLTHTEVPERFRSRGIAAELVKNALGYCKEKGLTVIPTCSYVAYYIDNHTQWRSVLQEGYQM